MSIFDFLKEIPLSALLREKLKDIEAEVATLKGENEKLRADSATTDEQIRALSQKLFPADPGRLNETQELILTVLARQEELPEQQVAQMVNVGLQVASYHLEELRRKKFVSASHIAGSDWSNDAPRTDWSLHHAGREYLIKHGLIQ